MIINRFSREFSFLSNFFRFEITYEGITYPTLEHAYQAAKTHDFIEKILIKSCKTPAQAKKLGRSFSIRSDWDEIKINIMEKLLRIKFSKNSVLNNKLLNTKDSTLIEGNNWGDRFWGQCPIGTGENNLGKLLMKIREEING